ncbi:MULTISPECIES: zf-TFIIB domain-containing protein [Asticcacaulis]|uniref:TFIIB-type zinc ribbon-containing protein n=1 Tax=Asticcacaulis TaxID=76890 RepID=UPI001AE7F36B|nr:MULTISPECIES: zf-TFIIB domain-containing protein [Asticcacaulis]MBP2159045.1 Zn-finger nucleic acid-binding protein [Asticcacaulis solisilvae]MDR6800090.1 Zn-finger nucleic acid-binding protein [Asticcacaulis sp. BE141]
MSAMTCPVCQGSFREVMKEGVLIDVCTQCRGVWLDRGELEKLLSLAEAIAQPGDYPIEDQLTGRAYGPREGYRSEYHDDGHGRRSHHDDGRGFRGEHGGRRRRFNLLDFFD